MDGTLKEYVTENRSSYYIETYGCQMNEHESEKLSGLLEGMGYTPAEDKSKADLIVFNTCCVREHAEARLYGNIGALKDHKQNVPGAIIAVFGCMMQQEDAAEKLQKRFPFIDIVFGTNHMHCLESMLYEALAGKRRVINVLQEESITEGLPVKRRSLYSAYVNIIYGCNNFCSYCIVPYVRGRERSRMPDDIINEISGLCNTGAAEITLLGQNVNSYGNDLDTRLTFPKLLERIENETNVKRIRFMTSHPKDLTDELISCYGRLESLCEHIHLPVQSGSDEILKRMNRRYTRDNYIELIGKLRQRVPDIAVSTDIIVGFPGETENDFYDTIDLVEKVRFDAAYTFAYSRRKLTKAASMPGQIEKGKKAERLAALNARINEIMKDKNCEYLGRELEVLAETVSKRNENELCGKTRSAKTVTFNGNAEKLGRLITVEIDKIKEHTLHGVCKTEV